ncbi:MAG: alcohol dehydrogenase catalytic domain-containing protein, partial [Chloroflexi bacterium]|nr:alcohol dehydrogenase catalytic domain-containing protein [Chloroflexota bacterium]
MESKTLRYLDDGSIELFVTEVGDPAEGEIQLTGGACGICSWDIVTAKLGSAMVPMAPPGHEGVGYVSKIGPGVTGIKEGDRVAGGGFATVRNLSGERVYPIPDSDLADEHWIVEPVACAVTGLDQTNLNAGETVALVGA